MSDYLEDTKISIINFNYFRQYLGFLTFPWPKKTNDFIKKSAIVQLWIWSICSWNMLMGGGSNGPRLTSTTVLDGSWYFYMNFAKNFQNNFFAKHVGTTSTELNCILLIWLLFEKMCENTSIKNIYSTLLS